MIKKKTLIYFLLLLLASASSNLALPCFAAQDIYINIKGIPGEAQNPEFSDNGIDVLSYSQNIAALIDPYRRLVRAIDFSDLTFQKYIDKASPLLYQHLAAGKTTIATILVVDASSSKAYWKIELEGVIVTSVSTGGSNLEDRSTENVSLAFTKVTYTYTNPQTSEGSSGGHDTTQCTPYSETCDGRDNDCDGVVDDNLSPIVITCGTGECSNNGMLICVDGSLTGECVAKQSSTEICDGLDNNCDGQVDDNLSPIIIICGTGECSSGGTSSCIDGALIEDCTPKEPALEICDGLDNDCDDTIDEPAEADLSCNDNNPCTDDICGVQVSCQNISNNAPCDDNNACTENDICSSGICISGPALSCDDNNSCTTDSCDPQSGCKNTTNNSDCEKGLPWLMLLLED